MRPGSMAGRMALGGRNKRSREKSAGRAAPADDGGGGRAAGAYLVGQVADSLLRGQGSASSGATRLAALFSAPASRAPLVFVPALQESRKRRDEEPDEGAPQPRSPRLQAPAEKKGKKKLSPADLKLSSRESALASADLDEEIHQKQGKKGKVSQSSAEVTDKNALDDVSHSCNLSQRKKIEINPEEERLKNERTVFVGNLPVTCNKKKLKSFFKEYGQIESVRFRSLIPAEGTRSKKLAAIKRKIHPDQKNISAYVVFKEEMAATKALKRNGAQIADGFRIRVDLASETCSRDKRSVFVGNLPYKVEESAVEKHFLDCGSIVAVRIVRHPVTGVGKGFGYVLFENTDAVHLALKLNNSELMGRKLRVMRSVHKEKIKQQNSNPGLKHVSKPKQGLNSKNIFIGEKAVLIKKKKKGQKKNGQAKKQRKQK